MVFLCFFLFSVDEDAATSDTPETRVRRDVGPAKTKEVLVLEWLMMDVAL